MLGWNIYKLWSPDWWDNPHRVLQDIISRIKEVENNNLGSKEYEYKTNDVAEDKDQELEYHEITQQVLPQTKEYTIYKICELENNTLYNSDEFFDQRIKSKLIDQIQKVIEIEAPISHELLSRKILNAWGISRLGVRLNEYLSKLYSQLKLKTTNQNGLYFYWRNDQDPQNYNQFRVAGADDPKRNVEDLAKEEITNGIKEVLATQFSLPNEDLIKEVARIFGYNRLGGNVEDMMKLGINFALKSEIIINQNGRFVVKEML